MTTFAAPCHRHPVAVGGVWQCDGHRLIDEQYAALASVLVLSCVPLDPFVSKEPCGQFAFTFLKQTQVWSVWMFGCGPNRMFVRKPSVHGFLHVLHSAMLCIISRPPQDVDRTLQGCCHAAYSNNRNRVGQAASLGPGSCNVVNGL
uniref:Uncharacterized protein n=1 Tax=Eutreptiella gymnastica TaxID=73025 RepID=A0A7S4GCM9_9EUGL|mmetsp:Transcript_45415/g.74132  ORF Transcript_45415/g.74132 Transcript_45415/m.74132 type:complete len:146 (-) Transcript_45415:364-801(-)